MKQNQNLYIQPALEIRWGRQSPGSYGQRLSERSWLIWASACFPTTSNELLYLQAVTLQNLSQVWPNTRQPKASHEHFCGMIAQHTFMRKLFFGHLRLWKTWSLDLSRVLTKGGCEHARVLHDLSSLQHMLNMSFYSWYVATLLRVTCVLVRPSYRSSSESKTWSP